VARVNDQSGRGNNWTQPTLANRPILGRKPKGGRRNLLVSTGNTAAWGSALASLTTGVAAPDASLTAVEVVYSASFSSGRLDLPAFGTLPAGQYTLSIWARRTAGTGGFRIQMRVGGTLTVLQTISVPTDWTRVSATITVSESVADMRLLNQDANDRTIEFWRPQLEPGGAVTDYQSVGASALDVTEAGKADCHYLFCGGSADPRWMQTPTITPGTDKVQVFAGVRKLSDAARGIPLEFSASYVNNAGSFTLNAPFSGGAIPTGPNYAFSSRGSGAAAVPLAAVSFAAPISNVLTGIGDISGPVENLRVNGVLETQNTAAQGTGNYLAYPAFIGARAGTSFYFNGEIYALGVRFGPNLDTATIEKVEQYVASLVAEPTI
jgi:hypothetical protein